MSLLDGIVHRAKQHTKTIVLPEGKDSRIVAAAKTVHTQQIANIIVLVNEADVTDEITSLQEFGIRVEIIEQSSRLKTYSTMLQELRKAKGMTKEQADQLVLNSIYFGVMMVKNGDADGMTEHFQSEIGFDEPSKSDE